MDLSLQFLQKSQDDLQEKDREVINFLVSQSIAACRGQLALLGQSQKLM